MPPFRVTDRLLDRLTEGTAVSNLRLERGKGLRAKIKGVAEAEITVEVLPHGALRIAVKHVRLKIGLSQKLPESWWRGAVWDLIRKLQPKVPAFVRMQELAAGIGVAVDVPGLSVTSLVIERDGFVLECVKDRVE